jgi:hypothetical protein
VTTDYDRSTPPPALRARVIRSLRQRGLIASRAAQPIARTALAIAAGVLLFLAGGVFAPELRSPTPDLRPSFVLLLYEDSTFRGNDGSHVSEYIAWADSLRTEGVLVMGERLDPRAGVVSASDATGPESGNAFGTIGGLFVVRAADLNAAISLARTCPHVRLGGRVVVRPVATT